MFNLKLEFNFQLSEVVGLSEGVKDGSDHWATTRVRMKANRADLKYEN